MRTDGARLGTIDNFNLRAAGATFVRAMREFYLDHAVK